MSKQNRRLRPSTQLVRIILKSDKRLLEAYTYIQNEFIAFRKQSDKYLTVKQSPGLINIKTTKLALASITKSSFEILQFLLNNSEIFDQPIRTQIGRIEQNLDKDYTPTILKIVINAFTENLEKNIRFFRL
mgnify:FL=1